MGTTRVGHTTPKLVTARNSHSVWTSWTLDMAADSSTSAQRRRATKPLIEKRRRARINSSLAQLKEMVAKSSSNVQETRSNRLEKADILEMTVDYVKRMHGKKSTDDPAQQTAATDLEQSFKEGYKLCMAEVQNFLSKNNQKQISKGILSRSLQTHLYQILQYNLSLKNNKDSNGEYDFKCLKSRDECGLNGISETSRKNNYNDFHFGTSDTGCSYSSTSTDDEMAEANYASESKNDGQLTKYTLKNRIFRFEGSQYGNVYNLNTQDKMWRPW